MVSQESGFFQMFGKYACIHMPTNLLCPKLRYLGEFSTAHRNVKRGLHGRCPKVKEMRDGKSNANIKTRDI